jgi:signal transduction histidine kinase
MTRIATSFLLIIGFSEIIYAQQEFVISHYSQNNGLPQNSVNDLFWDQKNYLWLSTEEGLVRFDGNLFYSFNVGNTSFINSDRFRWILKDADERILTSTAFGKVVEIKGNHIQPTSLQVSIGTGMRGILPSHQSLTKIVNTMQNGLSKTWARPAQFVYVRNQSYALGINYIYRIQNGLSIDSIVLPQKIHHLINIGKRAYGIENGMLYYFDAQQKQLMPVKNQPRVSKKSKISIHSEKSTSKAYISIDNIIYDMVPSNDPLVLSYNKILDVSKTINGEINCISRNTFSNIIAIGTATNGLYLFKPKLFTTRNHQNNYVKNNGYYGQIAFNDSTVLTSYGDLISAHSSQTSAFNMHGISRRVIYKSTRGTLWTSRIDTLIYQTPGGSSGMIPIGHNGTVNNIIGYGDSLMVVTTKQLVIVYQFKIVNRISFMTEMRPMPYDDWTFCLIDHDSMLLSFNNSIYAISLSPPHKIEQRYPYPSVRSLTKYKDWILGTSYGHGIFIINKGTLTQLPLDKAEHLQKAHAIEIIKDDQVFISTNNGLLQTSVDEISKYIGGESEQLYYRYFGNEDGIENTEFNGAAYPCSVTLKNGNVSFSNMNGLVWFDPQKLKYPGPNLRPFAFDHVDLDGTVYPIQDTIFLPSQTEKIDFKYTVKYWHNPYNINLDYQLEGFTQNWSAMPPPGQVLSFTNLPAGTYNLKIRCQTGFADSEVSYETICLIKEPQFHETGLFFFLILIGATLLIVGIIFLYNKRLLATNALLEARVTERTQALEEKNESLRESENELRQSVVVKNKLISIISHDIVTPLKFISLVSKNFKSYDSAGTVYAKEVIKEIHHTSQRLYDNAQNILNWVRFQNNLLSAQNITVSPFAIVEELCELFRDVASMQKSRLLNEVDMDDIIKTDKNILTIILQNLISNAVKYTHSCTINLTSSTDQSNYTITVSDDGHGMSENNLNRIESIRNKSKALQFDDSADGTGLGYLIIFELAELINASISIQSGKTGTRISISIPKL